MADTQSPVPLKDVLKEERLEIEAIRQRRKTRNGAFCAGESRPVVKGPDAPIPGRGPAVAEEPKWPMDDPEWIKTIEKAHEANLVGLALSGGGIRSATFNLGVLQALADLKLLYRVDYLSTVSGGGYIGGWLAAWTKRLKSFAEVQKRLATNRVHQEEDKEPPPIRFLRMFSNYLTPKLGILSGDTWAMVAIYLRNMLLNQVTVLMMVSAVLLTPRLVVRLGVWTRGNGGMGWGALVLALGLLLLAFMMVLNNMEDLESRGGARQLTKPGWILALVGVPLFFDAVLGGLWIVANYGPHLEKSSRAAIPYGLGAGAGAVIYPVMWIIATALSWAYERWLRDAVRRVLRRERNAVCKSDTLGAAIVQRHQEPLVTKPRPTPFEDFLATILGAAGAGAFAGWLYALLLEQAMSWSVNAALTAAAPLVLGILLLAGTLHIGLMGIAFRDGRREWWGRLGGWLMLLGLAWTVIFWVALYFPCFIQHNALVKTTWKEIAAKYLTPTWILTTVGGVLASKGRATGKPGTLTWKDALAKAAPYVFVAGLLCWVSYGIWEVQGLKIWNAYQNGASGRAWAAIHTGWPWVDLLSSGLLDALGWLLVSISTHRLLWAIGGCLGVAALMAWRVDINQFSMHLFYRNRLVRCYLGASNESRLPNQFTGFDALDDIPLKELTGSRAEPYDGPYPVLNASLNLVKGKELAWQERKAESFVMTPKYCGYDVWLEEQYSPMTRQERLTEAKANECESEKKQGKPQRRLARLDRYGYRPTEEYAFPPPRNGPNLGLAMGISGAAASPNMGFYSSAPVAFLMTMFNVRLGQWLGNPRHWRTWRRSTPGLGLSCLLNELLAGTDDDAAYVYLSDGGHFENLGVYELVKRRCGLIIVCDAEEDGGYGYAGLGNAIRKCRIDLGIEIELDVTEITPKKSEGPSKEHCAVGKIHYENVDLNAVVGDIIYFKASLTSDEPTDVKNYKKTHLPFPHESTSDQWFSESQFESYRSLGYHEVFSSIKEPALSEGPQATAHVSPPTDPHAAADHKPAKKAARESPPPLEKQLYNIFEKFGFDTSTLAEKEAK